MALKKAGGLICQKIDNEDLFRACVFSDSLCAFTDRVFGQFTWQQKSHWCLDFATRYCRATIVIWELGWLIGDSLKDVIDKRVHDAHGLAWDASVWVNLLEDFVNVDGVGFLPLLLSFAFSFYAFHWLDCFFGSFWWSFWSFWWHFLNFFFVSNYSLNKLND